MYLRVAHKKVKASQQAATNDRRRLIQAVAEIDKPAAVARDSRSAGEVGIGALVKRSNPGAVKIFTEAGFESVPDYEDRRQRFYWRRVQ